MAVDEAEGPAVEALGCGDVAIGEALHRGPHEELHDHEPALVAMPTQKLLAPLDQDVRLAVVRPLVLGEGREHTAGRPANVRRTHT